MEPLCDMRRVIADLSSGSRASRFWRHGRLGAGENHCECPSQQARASHKPPASKPSPGDRQKAASTTTGQPIAAQEGTPLPASKTETAARNPPRGGGRVRAGSHC